MKNRFLILLFSYFLLFNACMVDNFEENSLLLEKITEVKLTSSDTVFLKREGTYLIRYATRFYSNNREVIFKNTIKPTMYLNGEKVERTEIDLAQEGTIKLEAEFPNKSKILSNKLNIRVLELKDAISEITLKPIENAYYINKAETQDRLSDFVEIEAKLKTNEVVNLKPFTDIYSFEYNGSKLSSDLVGELPSGKFSLSISAGGVVSNSIEFEVFDPVTFIKSIELTLDERTRNNFAVAGSSELDFAYQVIAQDNTVLPISANLFVDGEKQDSFKNIPIKKAGTVNIHAEISGKKSNTIQVISRQDKVLQKIRVPVIFHVLDNLNKAISRETVEFEILKLNQAFANEFFPSLTRSGNAVEIFMEFFLADKDESGTLLAERGINRIASGGETFGDFSEANANYLFQRMWDPRRYVNVFVGRMDRWGGYAYFPVVKDIELPGIWTMFENYVLDYPYATVMSDNEMGNVNDATLAHEIGHMLALYHPFDRTGQGQGCFDGDFCLDTETHLVDASNSLFTSPSNIQENCQEETFYSANIMDYVTQRNSFTYDQRERIRTAALYSPFFAKEANYLNGRLSPFARGKINYNIKPQVCANPHHFGRKYHHEH
jgi:hypothetical protein